MIRQTRFDRAARDQRAQELRRSTPGSDRPLLRRLRLLGCKLVVEVDGDHHSDQLVYDARRDHRLGEMGFRVLRFWAPEVDEPIEGVIETIADALSTLHSKAPHESPPAPRGEDGSIPHLLRSA